MDTIVDCKAVEVIKVIEKVNSKKTGCKNHRWRRRIEKTTMSLILAAIASRLLISERGANAQKANSR